MSDLRIPGPEETELLVSLVFQCEQNDINVFTDILRGLASIPARHISVHVFTDGPIDVYVKIEKIARRFRSGVFSVSGHLINEPSHGDGTLHWAHTRLLQSYYSDHTATFTHYIALNDHVTFGADNFRYFLLQRQPLEAFGLIPSYVRWQYNWRDSDFYHSDVQAPIDLQNNPVVATKNGLFICPEPGYCGAFVLDRQLMAEYLTSIASRPDESEVVMPWGKRERAFGGLARNSIPFHFQSRYAVLLGDNKIPAVETWIHAVGDLTTNDYKPGPNFVLGKTPITAITGLENPHRLPRAFSSAHDDTTIKTIDSLFSNPAYQRDIPPLFGPPDFIKDVISLYNTINNVPSKLHDSKLVSITDAVIYNSCVMTTVGSVIARVIETQKPPDMGFFQNFDSSNGHNAETLALDPDTVPLFVGSVGSFNYGHWLVEDLPRVAAAAMLAQKNPGQTVTLLITSHNAGIDDVRETSARKMLGNPSWLRIVTLGNGNFYKLPQLYYATPVTYHPTYKSPAAMHWVSENAQSCQPLGDASRPTRIFLLRKPPQYRGLLNWEQIVDELAKVGFVTIEPGKMSFDEQLTAMTAAETVVTCMGAEATNIILCPIGIKVLALAPSGWVEPFFWDLACVRGDRYVACYGETEGDPNAAAHMKDYSISLATLREGLATIDINLPKEELIVND